MYNRQYNVAVLENEGWTPRKLLCLMGKCWFTSEWNGGDYFQTNPYSVFLSWGWLKSNVLSSLCLGASAVELTASFFFSKWWFHENPRLCLESFTTFARKSATPFPVDIVFPSLCRLDPHNATHCHHTFSASVASRPCQLAPRVCDPMTCGVAFGCWWRYRSVHPVYF